MQDGSANPKTVVSKDKPDLWCVPDTALFYMGAAMRHGAEKYGRMNWRVTGARFSVYINAMQRHLSSLKEGHDIDRESGLPHLAHIMAGAAVLLDAIVCGVAHDDRAPTAPVFRDLLDGEVDPFSRR